MGIRKKSAKGRLDKYYHLAKEQGYRARSAFKLIQLNKKYNFLGSAKALVDLCAAPGGWLQVAQKYMPSSSIIIGVDLVPIKAIPGVVTLTQDITTDKCRSSIKQNLMNWKADVVLHDGAPNVGSAWEHDAFTQSELVLSSLKLATEFLKEGGIFVTKVFRSKDYNNLMWVFNNLFEKVEATKPASSRNVSAEIFVVCQKFIAPKQIDPKFLDPKYVFEDLELDKPQASIDIFAPEKKQKKRHREGYEEGNYTQHKKSSVFDFINSKDPASVLGSYSELTFDTEDAKKLAQYFETNQDIIIACQDLKVLGKKDFRSLMKWRLSIRKRLNLDELDKESMQVTVNNEENKSSDENSDNSENELDLLANNEKKRARKERRRINEKRQKQIVKIQMNMTTPMDIGLDQDDNTLFAMKKTPTNLSNIKGIRESVKGVNMDSALDIVEMPDSDDELEYYSSENENNQINIDDELDENRAYILQMDRQLDSLYQRYTDKVRERDSKLDIKKMRSEQEEFRGFDSDTNTDSKRTSLNKLSKKTQDSFDMESYRKRALEADDSGSESSDAEQNNSSVESSDDELEILEMKKQAKLEKKQKQKNNLLGDNQKASDTAASGFDPVIAPTKLTKKASLWFDQPLFKNMNLSSALVDNTKKNNKSDQSSAVEDDSKSKSKSNISKKSKTDSENVESESDDAFMSSDIVDEQKLNDSDDDFEIAPSVPDVTEIIVEGQDLNDETDYSQFATPEALTIAHDLINKKITKEDLIDKYFNRHAFNEMSELPAWYVDGERQYNKPNLPISKEAVQMLKSKMRAINTRPIKKVMEAKARKKLHASQKVAKLKAKAETMINNDDMTESEKAKNIDKLMKSSIKKLSNKQRKVNVVVAKGGNKGIKGRPKATKGRYKMVDSRLRKDTRAIKANNKKKSKKSKK
ncbi:hypothetical protein BB561_002024 [Smittium simulii]|uniref:Uncharacterized protein n=1 Tax=Smittium simulii TaxID=133385 RepID=A0A2T9YRZ6_9FUNG|nr:hypothetical protein BB561_002024 [Smittium simulii]